MKVLDYTGTNHLVSKTKTELAKKVDKVTGKGLSTNDYTNAEKAEVAKISGIESDIDSLDLTKANIDGYYGTLSVGLADNLIDRKGNGTPQEISYRTSCGDDSIADDGNGIIQSIFGKTLVWNQHFRNPLLRTVSGVTISMDGNAIILNGTANATDYWAMNANVFALPIGHKILLRGCVGGSADTYALSIRSGGTTYYDDVGGGYIYTLEDTFSVFIKFKIGTTFNNTRIYPQCIDLTQLFGSGNEPSTVDDPRIEWVKQYANDHPEYNSGELISYNGSGIKTVGFNQWDKNGANTINGYFLDSNQPIVASSSRKIAYIPCFPNTKYCARKIATLANERFAIGYTNETPQVGSTVYAIQFATYAQTIGNVMTVETTTGADAKYLVVWASWDSTWEQVKETLNINFSWSGYRNGEYEPYWSRTLNLPISTYFPDGMKSAGSVRDEMTKDKAVKRIGKVTYTGGFLPNATSNNYLYLTYANDDLPVCTNDDVNVRCISDLFTGVTASNRLHNENTICVISDKRFMVCVSTTDFADANAFNTYLSNNPVTIYYELAEPTETTITPPLDLTYKVADFGTEESIAEGKSTPFNGIIKYSDDFTRGLVNMPKNYDTTASLDALATSLSTMLTSALDGTVTITRGAYDSTNKKYAWNCSFTPNA